ncbi:MAG: hypothetical protein LBS77_02890 [Desulfovibrio sp.]|jgi:formate hydrogenlyase subunit 3/multisubunit Na+/H+ antiporter MnhD subunit|nr:hypothetical protein [Desulfovibrio sp.]
MQSLFYTILALLLGGAFFSLLAGRTAPVTACVACVGAGLLGLTLSLNLLSGGIPLNASLPLMLPLGDWRFRVDGLSAFFLAPVFLLACISGAILPGRVRCMADESGARLAVARHCACFCLLIAGMVLTLTAADGALFLVSWEIMSIMPFFLISPLDRDVNERNAVWVYLTAARLGVLPLLLLFAGMVSEAGGTSFALFAERDFSQYAGLYFVLALLGFGLKAGLIPLHVWMPEAHSSAPGHIAVLLSGAMLNVGLYGLFRMILLVGPPETWWAYTLMGVGAFSGVTGILLGLVQTDFKRTLAYSSAENMGIISLALGGAFLAGKNNAPTVAVLLLTGVFLHIWNHSLFKSLLFLAANALKEHTHTTLIHRLGGLQKRIPVTGGCFAMASAAIAGIPPLNGFMSELLLYLGFGLGGKAAGNTETMLLFWGAFFILGGIAGMTLFAFVRVYGLAFLGAPRSPDSLKAREPETLFQAAMLLFAVLCASVGLFGPQLLCAITPLADVFARASGFSPESLIEGTALTGTVLHCYALAGIGLVTLCILAALARARLVARNGAVTDTTWACGYSRPTAAMQYTGGSFARTFALLLHPLARTRTQKPKLENFFPEEAKVIVTTPDWPTQAWDHFLFRPVVALAEVTKSLQTGLVNLYILYIFIALVAALTWALGWA